MKRFISIITIPHSNKLMEEIKMATLLTRMAPDAKISFQPGSQVWSAVDGVKKPFDLVGKLKDGSVVASGTELLLLPTSERPFITSKAEKRALDLANRLGHDYVMLAQDDVSAQLQLGHEADVYLAQFYVNATGR